MTPVIVVALVIGAILLIAAIAVFWIKKDMSAGGVAVTLVGLALVGMSQWSTIKLSALGSTIELTNTKIKQTAEAAEEVAAQAELAAQTLESLRGQVGDLTALLQDKSLLGRESLGPLASSLQNAPRVDQEKLRQARLALRSVAAR